MEVKQVAELVNTTTQELVGEIPLATEDLSNIVDVGKAVFATNDVDAYVKALINHIGKVKFISRTYKGAVPNVLYEGWEYASALQVIDSDMPDASENATWALENGKSYDPNVFHKPTVESTIFNDKVTFEIVQSFPTVQVYQSFDNATQMVSFISMLETKIENAMTIKMDSLIMRTINHFTGTVLGKLVGGDVTSEKLGATSGVQAINLLKEYKDLHSDDTAVQALNYKTCATDPEFLRYMSLRMGQTVDRMRQASELFNINGKTKFTNADYLNVVLLSDYVRNAEAYLQSDTYHDQYVKLPNAETVSCWQGSGTDFGIDSVSAINLKTSQYTVEAKGIIGVMFDREALGVCNLDRRNTQQYNAPGEFFNTWYKMDAGYFNNFNENFVVFYAL